nr:hypothetical protein [Tanacetum cinerariifolium]
MNELLNMMQSFCELILQREQTANLPYQEMSIQDIEDLKQQECKVMIDELKGKFNGMSIEINKKKELQQLELAANLSTYTTESSRQDSTFPLNETISQIHPSIAITPVLPTMEPEDSLIMGNEELSTILKMKSDELIKSSVEDFVPILSESEDTSGSDSECDLPSCDDLFPINVLEGNSVTFSNPLFDSNDNFTSSNNESLSNEDISEDNVKIYSNPLFEFDDEYISSDINPLFDEDGYHDSEGDILYLESLLTNDTIPSLHSESDGDLLFHLLRPQYHDDMGRVKLETRTKTSASREEPMITPNYEDSHARGFVHRLLELQSLAYGNPIS